MDGADEMDTADWRTQLQHDSRKRAINKIMEILKRHFPILGPEGLVELNDIATRFEMEIFGTAESEWDYRHKIALKMATMEIKAQTSSMANTLPSNSSVISQNPPHPVYSVRETEQFMDCNNSIPSKEEPNMDTTDWRTQLHPGYRQRIVNKICRHPGLSPDVAGVCVSTLQRLQDVSKKKRMEVFMRHLWISGPAELNSLDKIAVMFENRIYTNTTSQSDYLHKISLKLLAFENSHGASQNPPDSGLMHAEQLPEVTSLLQRLELDD